MLLIMAVITWRAQKISSRRLLLYEIRAAAPLIHAPAEVSKDLQVVYEGTVVKDPYFMELRLVNKGREDIPSSAFDQGMPIQFNLGVDIIKLLQITLQPDELPSPEITANGSAVEIGPSLIRGHQEISIALLADGREYSLKLSNPVTNVRIKSIGREDSAVRGGMSLKAITGWLCVAFLVWWGIEQPAGAAHVVSNVGTFFTTVASGLSKFFASL